MKSFCFSGAVFMCCLINTWAMAGTFSVEEYGRGYCFKRQNGNLSNSNHDMVEGGECTEEMFDGLKLGEWIARLAHSDVRGISVCSNIVPPIVDQVMKQQVDEDTLNYYNMLSLYDLGFVATDVDNINTLSSQWVSQSGGKALDADMFYCWCKLSDEDAHWVYSDSFGLSVETDILSDDSVYKCDSSYCALFCAQHCANSVRLDPDFRKVVFGGN